MTTLRLYEYNRSAGDPRYIPNHPEFIDLNTQKWWDEEFEATYAQPYRLVYWQNEEMKRSARKASRINALIMLAVLFFFAGAVDLIVQKILENTL